MQQLLFRGNNHSIPPQSFIITPKLLENTCLMDSIGTRFRERIPPIATKAILTASRIVFFPNEFIFLILFVNKHINSKGEEADAASI